MRGAGRGLGRGLSYIARNRFEMGKRHLRRVLGPDASEDEVEAKTREMFASYGRYWAEVFWFRPRRKDEVLARVEISGLEPVFAARDSNRGMIFALPHIGNWDAAGAVAEAIGVPVMAVMEDLPNPMITEWFHNTRRAFGIVPILAGKGDTTRLLLRYLKGGGAAALVSDRDLTRRGVDVEFFGEKTTMPAGPVALADRTGAALFPVGAFFDDGAGYRMVVYPELEIPDHTDRSERIAVGTQELAHRLEEMIRAHPEQWHVIQPNWPSDREWLEARR